MGQFVVEVVFGLLGALIELVVSSVLEPIFGGTDEAHRDATLMDPTDADGAG